MMMVVISEEAKLTMAAAALALQLASPTTSHCRHHHITAPAHREPLEELWEASNLQRQAAVQATHDGLQRGASTTA